MHFELLNLRNRLVQCLNSSKEEKSSSQLLFIFVKNTSSVHLNKRRLGKYSMSCDTLVITSAQYNIRMVGY